MGHPGGVAGDFGGEVAGFYARYRRGYPASFVARLARALRLSTADTAADLGCGTGQLTIPLAGHARAVAGLDPEPAMLALAAEAAAGHAGNITWVLGGSSDLPALASLLGGHCLGAITIANAIHLMPPAQVLAAARELLRPGGGIAVIANGTPVWQQPSDWSRALRGALERWLGTRLESCCGTDQPSRQRYQAALRQAGFTGIEEESADYTGQLTFDELIGHLYSAMPASLLPPPGQRQAFAAHIRDAIGPGPRFTEPVRLAALIGRTAA